MRKNTVKEKWRRGEPTVGTWLNLGSPLSAEMLAHAGFDWLTVDQEHYAIDLGMLQSIFQAISTTDTIPMVRLAWNDPILIKRSLDAGAYGLVVPMINSREDAIRAVQASRYPPQGFRSMGGGRKALYAGADYPEHANEEIAVIVQIEHIDAVRNVDDILTVEGVDAFFIGPNDLAASMGLPIGLDNPHPDHMAAVAKVLEAGKRHGVPAGIHTGSGQEVLRRIEEGFQFIAISGDSGFMTRAAQDALAVVAKARAAASREVI
ncbi:MAG: hypothetical protein HY677_01405 [Chloroflexi bacterium]|nr:hypothetical protein [Chloroflexota bacterium]